MHTLISLYYRDVSNNLIEFVRTIDLSDGLDNLRFL